jgi:alpha-ketoglutarate-dependent taurine dioxygenase
MEARTSAPARAPAAWKRGSFASPSDYTLDLTARDRADLAAALDAADRAGRLAPAHALTKADFRFGELAQKLEAAYQDVRAGRGFVVLRGLPVDGSLDRFIAAVWGVGLSFGYALSQNPDGELIGHVIDASGEDATPRMYRSNFELRPHNDITAMISLACWHKSQSGGATAIVSAATVHDEIRRRAPHLLEPLYRGFHYHRLGEEGPGEEPVTPYRIPVFAVRNGQVSCRYQRAGLAAGHHELGLPLSETEMAAIDLFDQVALAPENRLAFFLERGDMVVINNYAVMHARSGFVNYPEPERRRHLVRLWLDAPGFRDVPREFNHFATNGVPPQKGRRCTYDFKKLYRESPVMTRSTARLNLDDAEALQGR